LLHGIHRERANSVGEFLAGAHSINPCEERKTLREPQLS